ncbi:MAG: hypothetical protein CEN91_428, partial [Candidatus Berkelbacteria bacterium Licking1014_85]
TGNFTASNQNKATNIGKMMMAMILGISIKYYVLSIMY